MSEWMSEWMSHQDTEALHEEGIQPEMRNEDGLLEESSVCA